MWTRVDIDTYMDVYEQTAACGCRVDTVQDTQKDTCKDEVDMTCMWSLWHNGSLQSIDTHICNRHTHV